jgi:hypothetical protein
MEHINKNAEADKSTVIYAYKKRIKKNPPVELMITVMLHKMDDSEWTEEELSPVTELNIVEVTKALSVLGAEITLSDNKKHVIDFQDIDGRRSC